MAHSVMLVTEVDLPRPQPEPRRRGLRAWLTRANRKADARYAQRLAAWEEAGGKGKQATYIPRATITPGEPWMDGDDVNLTATLDMVSEARLRWQLLTNRERG